MSEHRKKKRILKSLHYTNREPIFKTPKTEKNGKKTHKKSLNLRFWYMQLREHLCLCTCTTIYAYEIVFFHKILIYVFFIFGVSLIRTIITKNVRKSQNLSILCDICYYEKVCFFLHLVKCVIYTFQNLVVFCFF